MLTIGVKGVYFVSFDAPSIFDGMIEDDLVNFAITERAGGELPTWTITMYTSNDEIDSIINERSTILVKYGIASNDPSSLAGDQYATVLLLPQTSHSARAGNRRLVTIDGVLYAPGYSSTTNTRILGASTSIEAAKLVSTPYFTASPDFPTTQDTMNWIQPAISDARFLEEILLHAYLPNSWVAYGVTALGNPDGRGVLRIEDMAKLIRGKTLWYFTNEVKGVGYQDDSQQTPQPGVSANTLPQLPGSFNLNGQGIPVNYDENYLVEENYGLLNNILAYPSQYISYLEDGTSIESLRPEISPARLSNSNTWLQNDEMASIGRRVGRFVHQTANTHPHYHQAALNNLTNLAIFSSHKMTISYSGVFAPMRILDLVEIDVRSSNDPMKKNVALSGKYIISAVTRSIANRQIVTSVVLTREGPNLASAPAQSNTPSPSNPRQNPSGGISI